MCIRELIDQFEIQGAFCIKVCDDYKFDYITLVKGNDFECDKWDISDEILERKIAYMYAIDGVLHIELEWE
jgi:hypothetical protein